MLTESPYLLRADAVEVVKDGPGAAELRSDLRS
jgi:hypothetical protein